jgi:hypothetical protein
MFTAWSVFNVWSTLRSTAEQEDGQAKATTPPAEDGSIKIQSQSSAGEKLAEGAAADKAAMGSACCQTGVPAAQLTPTSSMDVVKVSCVFCIFQFEVQTACSQHLLLRLSLPACGMLLCLPCCLS